jgi:hypothetical protein
VAAMTLLMKIKMMDRSFSVMKRVEESEQVPMTTGN